MMDVPLCCLSGGTAPNVQLSLLKWAFFVCVGLQVPFLHMPWVNSSAVWIASSCFQVSKIRLSWSKLSRNSFCTSRELGKCSQPGCSSITLRSGMMGGHLALELQGFKQTILTPPGQSVSGCVLSLAPWPWHWAGGFKCLALAAGTSQRGLGQALLLWEQQDLGEEWDKEAGTAQGHRHIRFGLKLSSKKWCTSGVGLSWPVQQSAVLINTGEWQMSFNWEGILWS